MFLQVKTNSALDFSKMKAVIKMCLTSNEHNDFFALTIGQMTSFC